VAHQEQEWVRVANKHRGQPVELTTARTKLYELLQKKWKKAVVKGDEAAGADRMGENLFLVMGGDQEERDWVQRRYMGVELEKHPGPCIVVGTIAALGTGMDWHDSDVLAFSCLPYKHGDLKQAEDRVWRQGQRRPVEIVFFFAEGTYDERLVEILGDKAPHAAAVGDRVEAVTAITEALEGVVGHEAELRAGILDFVAGLPADEEQEA
jgi:hypothetical protein